MLVIIFKVGVSSDFRWVFDVFRSDQGNTETVTCFTRPKNFYPAVTNYCILVGIPADAGPTPGRHPKDRIRRPGLSFGVSGEEKIKMKPDQK